VFTLRWRRRLVQCLGLLTALLLWILKYPLGRRINPKADAFAWVRGYHPGDLLPPDDLEAKKAVQLFGYQASRNVVFTFASFFISSAVAWEVVKPWMQAHLKSGLWDFLSVVSHLFSNPLFAACVVVVSLGFLERLLPLAIWWSINKLIVWRNRVFGRAMIQGLDAMRHQGGATP
jgi:hypothetical protein